MGDTHFREEVGLVWSLHMMDKNTCGCKWQSPEGRRRECKRPFREETVRCDDLMTTIGAHKRVNLNKTVAFQEMTKRRMVPLLGVDHCRDGDGTEGAATGLGPGNEGAAAAFELSYLLFASRLLLSPHFLCSSISVRWDTCLFLPGIFFPFHTNLQQGFEMKRKKKT